MKKLSFIIGSFVLITATGVQAQSPDDCPQKNKRMHHRMERADLPRQQVERPLRGEMHEFIRELRVGFDKNLTDSDRQVIQSVREDLQEHRDRMRAREDRRLEGKGRLPAGQREWLRQKLEGLDPVIEDHRDELVAIQEEIDNHRKEIMEDLPDSRNRPGKDSLKKDDNRRIRHFLLMDPDCRNYGDRSGPPSNDGFLLFPNPAEEQLNIKFDLKVAGQIKFELLDKSGNALRILEVSEYEQGRHLLSFDISDLKAGEIYYVRRSSPGGPVVKKFVKM